MFISCHQTAGQNRNIKVAKNMAKFRHCKAVAATNENFTHEAMKKD
jgi:hypothetical protein